MRTIVTILAVVVLLAGCSKDKGATSAPDPEPEETVLYSKELLTRVVQPSIIWLAGCYPCDQLSRPGCDTTYFSTGCDRGWHYGSVGCEWQGGRYAEELYLGSFNLKGYSYVWINLKWDDDEHIIGTSNQGSTWYTSSNLNDFLGESNVAITLKLHLDFSSGESVPSGDEYKIDCAAPAAHLVLRDIELKARKPQ